MLSGTLIASLTVLPLLAQKAVHGAHGAQALIFFEEPLINLTLGLTEYFMFYNVERAHQSLGNRTSEWVYASGQGEGTVIIDKFGKDEKSAGSAEPCARLK